MNRTRHVEPKPMETNPIEPKSASGSPQETLGKGTRAAATPAPLVTPSALGSNAMHATPAKTPLERMQRFNREHIPERMLHAKGAGAYGSFTVTRDCTKLSCAKLFEKVGKKTDAFVRFSMFHGEHGSADSERDIRGFAVRFYTEDGNWDLICNNTPVYFIRDPNNFTALIHSQQRHPQSNLRDPDMQWEFLSHSPESTHQITFLYGDSGCPDGYRSFDGYGGNTFSLTDLMGHRVWCKFHLRSKQRARNLSDEQAARMRGGDPDSAQRDLFDAIARGEFPKWRLCVQTMTSEEARGRLTNPFDVTKTWPESEFPLIELGELELNRNPVNYFAEVEQAAFNPAALIPGIGSSPDRMLQARFASYSDAQMHRLGAQAGEIPVNRSRCPLSGFASSESASKSTCSPTKSPGGFNAESPCDAKPDAVWKLATAIVDRFQALSDQDDYTQARALYLSLDPGQRERLSVRIADSLGLTRIETQTRQLGHFFRTDEDYGKRVAMHLGIDVTKSMLALCPPATQQAALAASH